MSASRSISSRCWPRYSIERRGTTSRPESSASVSLRPWVSATNGFDQGDQEGRCGNTIGFFGKLDEGELRSSVDRHEEVELSLGGLHFGHVDVEEADRIGLELFLCRLVAFDLSKTADPMPLQTTMQ